MISKRFLLYSGLVAIVAAFAPVARAQGQAPVSSQNATVQYPTPFTPAYIGGSGSGNWEFLISGYTTWSLSNGSPTGTKLSNGTWVTAWTPPASGSYSFNVAHLGSGSYAVATSGSYTLTVTAPTNGITWNSISNWPATGTEGTNITFSASVTNSGSTTWGSGYSIVVIDNTTGSQVASTAISGAPGTTLSAVTFTIALPSTLGNRTYNLQAYQSGVQFFGAVQSKTINIVANKPSITSASSYTGTVGSTFYYAITATNSPTSYNATNLPAGVSVNTSTGVISGTPTTAGSTSVSISATNSGGTANGTLAVTINPQVPVVTSASKTGTVGSAFSYQISATNSPTSYNATGLPGGLSVNTSNGLISGTPTSASNSTVGLSATNSGGTGTGTLSLTVNPLAPVITSQTSETVTLNTALSYSITATNSPTSYNATGLPSGVSVNTSSGLISGTPTATGTYTIPLSASNSGGTGTATLTLSVVPPAPVINSATSASGTVGFAFNYQISATNSPTSYNATNLPAGLSINTSTGLISGTPTGAVTNPVTISATNAGGTTSETITVTISNPSNGITWNGTINWPASAPAGSSITVTASVTNSGTTTWTNAYSIAIVDSASGIQVGSAPITGAPGTTLSTVSLTFTLNATVQNGRVYDLQAYQSGVGFFGAVQSGSINLVEGVPVISTPQQTATVGTFFSYAVQASYMTVEPYSYNATGLPPGLSINTSNGLISGTPTTTGTYNVSLSATNTTATGTGVLNITVGANSADIPSIPGPLSATATVGIAFSYTIVASGGAQTPQSFAATGLPAGLSLAASTGVISGTPTVAGTSSVSLTATNTNGTSPVTILTLTVQPAGTSSQLKLFIP